MKKYKIGIIGAGPVGLILGAHLGNSEHDVFIVDILSDLVSSIKTKGIKIVGKINLESKITDAFTEIEQLYNLNIDYVFLCVKAVILPEIINQLKKIGSETYFICFQNGIDTEKIVTEIIPQNKVFRGIVNYAGGVVENGVINMTFFHTPNFIGNITTENKPISKEISNILTQSGLETKFVENIRKEIWRKSILNSVMMLETVITGLTMDRIMNLPQTKKIVENLLKEFLLVAKAEGYIYEDNFSEKAIHYLSNAGEHKTSMLVDFEKGNPLEIGFLNEKLQEYADKNNITCTYNEIMISLVKGLILQREITNNSNN